MVVGDVVEEESAHPAHEGSVNGGGSTAEESPGILAEMGHGGIGVVEESEHDDPVVGEEIRNEIIFGEGGQASLVCPYGEEGDPGAETDVGDNDWDAVALLEECRRWEPVVGSWWVHWATEGVVGEVQLPSEDLHDDHAGESEDWSFLEHLSVVRLLHCLSWCHVELSAGLGQVVLITLHRASGFVVEVVGVAP